MCRCSWEREGGAPWVECGGGGLVEGWVGNRVNIKCWQATKPRQPQRKEEMSASEEKKKSFFLASEGSGSLPPTVAHPAANARCGGIKGVWLAFCFSLGADVKKEGEKGQQINLVDDTKGPQLRLP